MISVSSPVWQSVFGSLARHTHTPDKESLGQAGRISSSTPVVVIPVDDDGLVVLDGPPERVVELIHAVDLLHRHGLGHVPEVGVRLDPLPALPPPRPPPAAVPQPHGPPGRPAADGRAGG